ncbi:MAG: FtsQ-type POTRA domain-containing protein [Hyphomonas sp.]
MPKIERNQTVPPGRRPPATIVDEVTGEEVRVSSVIFGVVMLVAILVATAAWMGGSLSQIGARFGGFFDDSARLVGLDVKDVAVMGLNDTPVLAEEVRAAAMIEPGENMFRADPHLIRSRVEATQKVLNVRVHRLWPGQVVILADAAEPVALGSRAATDRRPRRHARYRRPCGRGHPRQRAPLGHALHQWRQRAPARG